MIDFETYLMWKFILAIVGVAVVFPFAMWWLRKREFQRDLKRKERS